MIKILPALILPLALLAACGEPAPNSPAGTIADKVEQQTAPSFDTMKPTELIAFVNGETAEVVDTLRGVTDKASAERAADEIRSRIPRLNSAIDGFKNIDQTEMARSLDIMRLLPKLGKTQSELAGEISRISKIPEARDVLKAELDKLDL